jgi:hypothetical protein
MPISAQSDFKYGCQLAGGHKGYLGGTLTSDDMTLLVTLTLGQMSLAYLVQYVLGRELGPVCPWYDLGTYIVGVPWESEYFFHNKKSAILDF